MKKIHKGPDDATMFTIPKCVENCEKDALEHMDRLRILWFNDNLG